MILCTSYVRILPREFDMRKWRRKAQEHKPSASDVEWMEKVRQALPQILQHKPGDNIAIVPGLLVDISPPVSDGSQLIVVRTAASDRREIGHMTSDGQVIYTGTPPRTD